MYDAPVREECHCLATTELHEHVVVRDKKHLLDLMELLETYDIHFARTWGWLDYKAELSMVSLALGD